MPIPVINEYNCNVVKQPFNIPFIYLNVIKNILDSRFSNGLAPYCLIQDQEHYCINQFEFENSQQNVASLESYNSHSIYLNILEKETNYLFERWTISFNDLYYHIQNQNEADLKSNNISQFISNLPLSKHTIPLYLITNFFNQSNQQCYSYLSNQHSAIEFKPNSQLKAEKFNLANYLSIEVVYDENITAKQPFISWSKMQEHTVYPLPTLNTAHPLQSSPPLSPHTPFVRRLSRLSLSAIEDDTSQQDVSRYQYTHYRSTPTNNRYLSTSFEERRSSLTEHHAFVGSFEESLLSGRMSSMPSKPIMFHCQIGVLGYGDCKPSLKCPPHWSILFPATFYKLPQTDQDATPATPYVGTVDISEYVLSELKKPSQPGYRIPPKGQLQVIIKNPNKTAVKLFLIPFDFTDMPKNTKTFLRQKSYTQGHKKLLRYAVHIQVCKTEKNRIYLYKTMRIVFANQKADAREKFDIVCEGPQEPVYIAL